jgi:hypothetical protein
MPNYRSVIMVNAGLRASLIMNRLEVLQYLADYSCLQAGNFDLSEHFKLLHPHSNMNITLNISLHHHHHVNHTMRGKVLF